MKRVYIFILAYILAALIYKKRCLTRFKHPKSKISQIRTYENFEK
jgi:hypothetical protein